ncbi:MAG: MFS transporter [Burkholderiales bacterium]
MRSFAHLPALRSFRHAAFRRFYAGQTLSVIGSWIQTIALGWLVYRLTASPLLLGLTTFLTQAPILFLTPVAGVLTDRVDRRALLVVTQALLAVQAASLGALTLLDYASVPVLLAASAVQGFITAFETPARQSFLSVLVPDRTDLPNAIALNSFLMNSGRLIGPGIAGLLLAITSEGVCFLVNSVSFLAVIAVVRKIRAPRPSDGGVRTVGHEGFLHGLRDAWRFRPARVLLPFVMTISLFASPYATLMPAVVKEVLRGGPGTLGLFVGMAGFGGLCGTAMLAAWRDVHSLPRVTVATCALTGLALTAFALSPFYWLSLIAMPAIGFGIIATAASVNMLLQTVTPPERRGRVIGLYISAFLGLAPFGALLAGFLASWVGALTTIGTGGSLCLLASVALRRSAHSATRDLEK